MNNPLIPENLKKESEAFYHEYLHQPKKKESKAEIKKRFIEYLEKCSEQVKTWPEWKKKVLK